ncbi:MAG: rRNA maturation RNase YbeY [Dysgonamonadaceae bacterium]|jgi:rRNA maturation RNase YbeY|nr:rRNA maturation RNase YbeY [Dysgonamonadaceae bacterium]
MPITFQAENHLSFPSFVKRRKTAAWIKQVAEKYGKKAGDVNYLFCDDERILSVNKQYLSHDYYTDIITFDFSGGGSVSGDIFISLDTVKSNSQKYQTDFVEELHRVIIHGVLHLCGLKDKSAEEAEKMRKAENEALGLLDFKTKQS